MPTSTVRTRLWLCLMIACAAGCSEESDAPPRADRFKLLPHLTQEAVAPHAVAKHVAAPAKIQLAPGASLHFVKSIQQRLDLDGSLGGAGDVEENVKLIVRLQVADVLEDRYRIAVDYLGVQYEADFDGREIRFHSGQMGEAVPIEAQPYAGLAGSGFSFWLSRDNELLDVVDFESFLQQCLSNYPADQRLELLREMGGLGPTRESRLESARTFLDDSIALLPYEAGAGNEETFAPGREWTSTLNASQPLRTVERLQLKLEHVADDTAHVIIDGTLSPASEKGTVLENGLRVKLAQGRITGSCSVDLATGMPKSSRILREFELELLTLSRKPVVVKKTVETRLDPWHPQTASR